MIFSADNPRSFELIDEMERKLNLFSNNKWNYIHYFLVFQLICNINKNRFNLSTQITWNVYTCCLTVCWTVCAVIKHISILTILSRDIEYVCDCVWLCVRLHTFTNANAPYITIMMSMTMMMMMAYIVYLAYITVCKWI